MSAAPGPRCRTFSHAPAHAPGSSGHITLIETVLCVIAGAVVRIGGFLVYERITEDSNTTETMRQLHGVAAGVHTLFSNEATYVGLDNDLPIQAGIAPPEMGRTAGSPTLTNLWRGTVTIAPSADLGNAFFDITYTAVPRGPCVRVLAHHRTASENDVMVRAKVNTTALTLPVSPSAADAGYQSGANTLTWSYRK